MFEYAMHTLMWHHIYRKPKSPHREREVHDAWYVLYVRPHSTRGIYVLLLYSTNQKKSFLDGQINLSLSRSVKVMEDNLACPRMEAPHVSWM